MTKQLGIIQKDYLTIEEVAAECGVPLEHLRYFGEEGNLTICLRKIPVQVAIESILAHKPYTENPKEKRKILQMLDAPLPLHPTDIWRLFANRESKIEITRLKTLPVMNLINVIKPSILVGFDDLIIMREEKERFAHIYLNKDITDTQTPLVIISPDFRNFVLYGREYVFGEKQARVIRFLYQKYVAGDPWVHSKKLLDVADAHSWRLHNLFNHKPEWRNVVKSGRNGWYMINLPTEKLPPARLISTDKSLGLFDFITNE